MAVAKPKSLVVLPQGAASSDPYRLSPDELLSLRPLAKRKGDVAAATRYYTELLESWHGQPGFGLSDAAYKQTIFALMELGMGRAAPAKLVQYCEVIKEKWPSEPVTLDQLLTAAGAYREIGELERSYMACRAAVEGNFTRESGVAGLPRHPGRVPPQRQPDEPAAARLSARALRGRGRIGTGPAGLCQGRRGPSPPPAAAGTRAESSIARPSSAARGRSWKPS